MTQQNKPETRVSQAPGLAASLAAAALLSLILLSSGVYLYLYPQLPNVEQLHEIALETPLQIYSSDGKLISEFGEKHSRPLKYAEIPPQMVSAFLAAEDDNFFHHGGVSIKGLGRAFADLLQSGSIQSGGSTITMQVAKNYFLSSRRTFSRKLTEILLAYNIEQALSKQEILALYVNKIFLGQRAYGVGAAAEVYYGKNVNQLSLAEIAMIAGLPKAPSKYNPVVNPKRALERRNWILGRMLQLGSATRQQYEDAVHAPVGLRFYQISTPVNAPWLAEMVRASLAARFGDNVQASGYKVYTTVRSDIQNSAVDAVIEGLIAYDMRHGWRGVEASGRTSLADFYPVGGLLPALVTTVGARDARATLKDGREIRLDWSAMSWARPYKSVNATGPAPTRAAQLLKTGDVIRVSPSGDQWLLRQVPNVQGQLIAMDPQSGAVQALVGGFDYYQSQFNRSIQGWRQAGSTLKPFIYTLALERGFTPNSIINDSPLTIGNWSPSNSDGEFMGPITLRRALYLSRNLVSVRLLQAVTVDRARAYLDRFGFMDAEMPKNLTLALGTAQVVPVQMATAYSVFATGGYRVNPYFIEKVVDGKGAVVYQASPEIACSDCADPQNTDPQPAPGATLANTSETTAPQAPSVPGAPPPIRAKRVMSAKAAYQMGNILRDVIIHGTARSALRLQRSDIAGKTGTTNDAKDAWFAGFTPRMVAVSWVGFDNPAPLGRLEYGGYAALPIWTRFMEHALADMPDKWLTAPAGMEPAPAAISKADDLGPEGPDGAPSGPLGQDATGSTPEGTPAQDNPDALFQ